MPTESPSSARRKGPQTCTSDGKHGPGRGQLARGRRKEPSGEVMLTRHLLAVAALLSLAFTVTDAVTAPRARATISSTAIIAAKAFGERICYIKDYRCRKQVDRPGIPGSPEPGHGSGGEGTRQPCISSTSGTGVPCTSPWGSWSNDWQCYLRADPAPTKPAPSGKTGRWYVCHRLDADPVAGGAESTSGWISRRRSTQGDLRSTSLPSYGSRRFGSVSRRRKARLGFLVSRPTSGSTTPVREHSDRSATPLRKAMSPSP